MKPLMRPHWYINLCWLECWISGTAVIYLALYKAWKAWGDWPALGILVVYLLLHYHTTSRMKALPS